MAIEIKETFIVAAPRRGVEIHEQPGECGGMHAGSLAEGNHRREELRRCRQTEDRGCQRAVSGTITYLEADQQSHRVKMLAEGNERGGGTVSGTIDTTLIELADGSGTEVCCSSSVDLTGKIVQVGRGMIEGVSAQIIKKYVANVRSLLEVPGQSPASQPSIAEAGSTATASPSPQPQPRTKPPKEDSINVVAVVLTVLWNKVSGFLKKLFGRP